MRHAVSDRPVPTGAAQSAWFTTPDDAPASAAGGWSPVALLERADGPVTAPSPVVQETTQQWTEDQLPWRQRPEDRFPAPRPPADDAPGLVATSPVPAVADHPDEHPAPQTPLRSLAGSRSVRRGVAAVAVTGGALSMMGAAVPGALPAVGDAVTGNAALASFGGGLGQTDTPELALATAVEPVAAAPDVLDDAGVLVKAVQLQDAELARLEAERLAAEEAARLEAERIAAEQEAREAAEREAAERRAAVGADCGLNTRQLGAVQSYVREAAEFLGCQYDVDTMHGVAGRAGTSDHPSGKAVDFMVDRATGDQLAQCALDNMDALGISYIIWEQRINTGDGWELMEDRGGATANHFDHVHVSFDGPGSGEPVTC